MAAGGSWMRTPSAASTSAAPLREDSARLPCLATGTPAPATTNAAQVVMLYEPDASPPVPRRSIAPGGAATLSMRARMVVTAPVISSTVSPRIRMAMSSAPIWEGVASPAIIRSKARVDSSRVRTAPVATLRTTSLNAANPATGPSTGFLSFSGRPGHRRRWRAAGAGPSRARRSRAGRASRR